MENTMNLRSLRLRMGWTASDLARRLGVSSSDVLTWEESRQTPTDSDMLTRIEFLFRQADMCCDETRNATLVEFVLEETHQEQIHFDSVKARSV